jgi:glycosyltransferase involved in cell wall biosynthesis
LDDDYPGTAIDDYVTSISDSRIKYFRNTTNLGVNANFRKALEFIETPYFMMFGSDDIMAPNYVETIISRIHTHPEISIFQPGVGVIDSEGQVIRTLVDSIKGIICPSDGVHSGTRLAARLMLGNFTYFPSITWKTDDVLKIGFRTNLHVTQDLALICDLLLAEHKMFIFSDQIFLYRRHTESDSSFKRFTGERFSEEIELCANLSNRFKQEHWLLASLAALVRPAVRIHMFLSLSRVVSQPRILLKFLKGIFF